MWQHFINSIKCSCQDFYVGKITCQKRSRKYKGGLSCTLLLCMVTLNTTPWQLQYRNLLCNTCWHTAEGRNVWRTVPPWKMLRIQPRCTNSWIQGNKIQPHHCLVGNPTVGDPLNILFHLWQTKSEFRFVEWLIHCLNLKYNTKTKKNLKNKKKPKKLNVHKIARYDK